MVTAYHGCSPVEEVDLGQQSTFFSGDWEPWTEALSNLSQGFTDTDRTRGPLLPADMKIEV